MTEEQIKQKAEEKAEEYSEAFIEKGVAKASYAKGYIAGATEILSKHIIELQKDKGRLTDENKELKILISSLVYEINQIWDIDEMNYYLRKAAEKIDREVTLSKMADDNRIVLSALGFAIVPPRLKADVKGVKL